MTHGERTLLKKKKWPSCTFVQLNCCRYTKVSLQTSTFHCAALTSDCVIVNYNESVVQVPNTVLLTTNSSTEYPMLVK